MATFYKLEKKEIIPLTFDEYRRITNNMEQVFLSEIYDHEFGLCELQKQWLILSKIASDSVMKYMGFTTKPKNAGKRIKSLKELYKYGMERKAIVTNHPMHRYKPCAIAFVMNYQGYLLFRLLNTGIYLYKKE